MMAVGRDEWICDLAETYGIFNYKALPTELLATLSIGLRESSRIKMKISGMKATSDTMLRMITVDCLRMLVWMNSEDGAKNTNRPNSLIVGLLGLQTSEVEAFETGGDFETRRKMILGEV